LGDRGRLVPTKKGVGVCCLKKKERGEEKTKSLRGSEAVVGSKPPLSGPGCFFLPKPREKGFNKKILGGVGGGKTLGEKGEQRGKLLGKAQKKKKIQGPKKKYKNKHAPKKTPMKNWGSFVGGKGPRKKKGAMSKKREKVGKSRKLFLGKRLFFLWAVGPQGGGGFLEKNTIKKKA